MADTTETVELQIDHSEMFKSALADDPPAAEPQPESTNDDKAAIPSWRLREVTEARQVAERRNEELSRQNAVFQSQMEEMRRHIASINAPKPEPVNWFENPEGALKQSISPIEQQLAEIRSQSILNSSEALAIARHGVAAVDEMKAAIETAQQRNDPELQMLAVQMQRSNDPVGIAMNWHKRMRALEITGGDPVAYEQKVKEKLLKDPDFRKQIVETIRAEASQNPAARPVVQMPTPLRGTGANESADAADMSDRAIFQHAMGGTRR
jgi:hypothetical protein